MPPTMTFTSAMWHPNSALPARARVRSSRRDVYRRIAPPHPPSTVPFPTNQPTLRCCAVEPDGKVCISILHKPGVDEYNQFESADERWRPIIGIEQVLVSVMAMLGDPNINSPANVDAAVSEHRACLPVAAAIARPHVLPPPPTHTASPHRNSSVMTPRRTGEKSAISLRGR